MYMPETQLSVVRPRQLGTVTVPETELIPVPDLVAPAQFSSLRESLDLFVNGKDAYIVGCQQSDMYRSI